MLQLFCAQQLRKANRMKVVDFQPSWDSLNLAKLSLKVKLKMSFFSERQNNFKEKPTACLHSCYGLAICKRRANLSFLALPKKSD